MVKLLSVEESYCTNDQTLKTTAKLQLTDTIKATCYNVHPGNAAGLGIERANWSISHHAGAKDTWLTYRKSLSASSKLAITQYVPGNKWFLVPNPAVKVTHTRVAGRDATMHASYDCLGRQATAGGSLYAGEDRQYKLTVGAATDQGLTAGARAKVRRGLMHSVSASVGGAAGPALAVKSRFADGTKVRTSFQAAGGVLRVVASHRAAPSAAKEAGAVATALLDVAVALPQGKGRPAPRVTLGLRWELP